MKKGQTCPKKNITDQVLNILSLMGVKQAQPKPIGNKLKTFILNGKYKVKLRTYWIFTLDFYCQF
jgi:hypothetical protein